MWEIKFSKMSYETEKEFLKDKYKTSETVEVKFDEDESSFTITGKYE